MTQEQLEPTLELLTQEYVLIQAWKKTASYIRYHNWYADTLALDRAAANLPDFLKDVADHIRHPDDWLNEPLRMVPAPKSQRWVVKGGAWGPIDDDRDAKLRPLAHASLKSQVAATALMMSIADRVESAQGDPRVTIRDSASRRTVISYGNRLFCDPTPHGLQHRWGSAKLYRAYYHDYRRFIERPEAVGAEVADSKDQRVVVVHSDLKQFYDRVNVGQLHAKLASHLGTADDPGLTTFASRLLNWDWHPDDRAEVVAYAKQAGMEEFSKIALPQGLVAAGFFANAFLIDFDDDLRSWIDTIPVPGVQVLDVARYVDDLRIVLLAGRDYSLKDIEAMTARVLQSFLDKSAPGLIVSQEKTRASELVGDERPLVRQSRKMARIQTAVSGGFDAFGGIEILDAVQGLIRSQQRYSEQQGGEPRWAFAPIPDVRDATVARFAANRYRSTYRSLRPMLPSEVEGSSASDWEEPGDVRSPEARTQRDLDQEAKAFAIGAIEAWTDDPSNVRLLRIGLDLWPAPDVLEAVLSLLRPFTHKGGKRKAPRRVAWYCLAEIFRAGATETGYVSDKESLPAEVDLIGYRRLLTQEAVRLEPISGLPWYLRQQVLLFLAVHSPESASFRRSGTSAALRHYKELILFLRGDHAGVNTTEFATLAVLGRRSYAIPERAAQLALKGLGSRRLEEIAQRDPTFAFELIAARPDLSADISPRIRDDLSLRVRARVDDPTTLVDLVLNQPGNGPIRNEFTLLSFALRLLSIYQDWRELRAVTPGDVRVSVGEGFAGCDFVESVQVVSSRVAPAGSIYEAPSWCSETERWRFQLGYLLRFVLTARPDFTSMVRKATWRDAVSTYRPGLSHWYQRLHGMFSGHSAFGDDWLPISEWTEHFIGTLLRWPGCRQQGNFDLREGPQAAKALLEARINFLNSKKGPTTGLLLLPMEAPWPNQPEGHRPLRACVVQSVVPNDADFKLDDLTCSGTELRKRHRRHLSAALSAVEKMLALRETHKGRAGRLDWLILPELSVHPDDVATHLVPFARSHKTIVLAGMTYEQLLPGRPLVNSALWILPVWSAAHGLQVRIRRQGKQHLAPQERAFNLSGEVIRGFRPCQWLVGYEWTNAPRFSPLWLTASICYDATDLALATDLRNHSDVFAIPALNRDVGTFDQMSLALHYHMFQMVIIANNGLYGGSNAYAPYKDAFVRQVFHHHGQPQASIAFLEIEPIDLFQQRRQEPAGAPTWKSPPAGIVC